ncbi:hypothetical protein NXY56_005063 [Leishmania guyanensis]|uniref:PH domain-containing protein n=1 Tax=Leishmania guyanensis TaxID=5670 RepID=A0A1E1J1U4_LEIGU|nr:hypothetical protein, unknown function [Leishmania guyanensis]
MNFAKRVSSKKSPNQSAGTSTKTMGTPKEAAQRSPSTVPHVSFADDMQVVSIPSDQDNPSDVWSIYSYAAYTTKKEQRYLKRSLQSRIDEAISSCSNLFTFADNDQEGKRNVHNSDSDGHVGTSLGASLTAKGYGKSIGACAMYVLSVWPSFPAKHRPPMSPKVQRSLEALQAGTRLYVFNEKPNSPLRCGTALRLLRSIDGNEASIAIYNAMEPTVIDGYIPLSLIVSLSFGLEPVERQRHLKGSGKIMCSDGKKKVEETSKRAFTLHCAAPERFYVTFIAANQEDFNKWVCVVDYFVLLNAYCRSYMQSN